MECLPYAQGNLHTLCRNARQLSGELGSCVLGFNALQGDLNAITFDLKAIDVKSPGAESRLHRCEAQLQTLGSKAFLALEEQYQWLAGEYHGLSERLSTWQRGWEGLSEGAMDQIAYLFHRAHIPPPGETAQLRGELELCQKTAGLMEKQWERLESHRRGVLAESKFLNNAIASNLFALKPLSKQIVLNASTLFSAGMQGLGFGAQENTQTNPFLDTVRVRRPPYPNSRRVSIPKQKGATPPPDAPVQSKTAEEYEEQVTAWGNLTVLASVDSFHHQETTSPQLEVLTQHNPPLHCLETTNEHAKGQPIDLAIFLKTLTLNAQGNLVAIFQSGMEERLTGLLACYRNQRLGKEVTLLDEEKEYTIYKPSLSEDHVAGCRLKAPFVIDNQRRLVAEIHYRVYPKQNFVRCHCSVTSSTPSKRRFAFSFAPPPLDAPSKDLLVQDQALIEAWPHQQREMEELAQGFFALADEILPLSPTDDWKKALQEKALKVFLPLNHRLHLLLHDPEEFVKRLEERIALGEKPLPSEAIRRYAFEHIHQKLALDNEPSLLSREEGKVLESLLLAEEKELRQLDQVFQKGTQEALRGLEQYQQHYLAMVQALSAIGEVVTLLEHGASPPETRTAPGMGLFGEQRAKIWEWLGNWGVAPAKKALTPNAIKEHINGKVNSFTPIWLLSFLIDTTPWTQSIVGTAVDAVHQRLPTFGQKERLHPLENYIPLSIAEELPTFNTSLSPHLAPSHARTPLEYAKRCRTLTLTYREITVKSSNVEAYIATAWQEVKQASFASKHLTIDWEEEDAMLLNTEEGATRKTSERVKINGEQVGTLSAELCYRPAEQTVTATIQFWPVECDDFLPIDPDPET